MNIADVLSGAAKWAVATGDCLDLLRQMPDSSVDSVVTDPPYGLAFMGKRWDYDLPDPAVWVECLRALKPGGHLLAFGGSRTYHRLACGVEDAGFEVRDQIMWVYGSGFPKSLDVGKAMDKAAGAEREVVGQYASFRANKHADTKYNGNLHTNGNITAPATDLARKWHGWGTALKPAHEPIVLARKPLVGTVAANVAEWGTGAVNVDGCRISGEPWKAHRATGLARDKFFTSGPAVEIDKEPHSAGRWPANLIHDGSEEVLAGFPDARSAGLYPTSYVTPNRNSVYNKGVGNTQGSLYADSGSAARFFYTAKANKRDRDAGLEGMEARPAGVMDDDAYVWPLNGDGTPRGKKVEPRRNHHPTVKPTDLMRYLCRLITPPGGIVLDPFTGSGSTGRGAVMEGFRFVGYEREAEYVEIARRRIQDAAAKPEQLTLGGEP